MSTVSGLYLESQAHIIEGGKTLDQYGPERFMLPARLVKLSAQPPRAQIDGATLAANAPKINPGDALLIATGWGAMWDQPGYVLRCPNGDVAHHPYKEQFTDFAECLAAGSETSTHIVNAFETHRVVFAADKSAETGKIVRLSEFVL